MLSLLDLGNVGKSNGCMKKIRQENAAAVVDPHHDRLPMLRKQVSEKVRMCGRVEFKTTQKGKLEEEG